MESGKGMGKESGNERRTDDPGLFRRKNKKTGAS